MIKCFSEYKVKERFPWICSDNVSFKGYVYVDGELTSDESAIHLFKGIKGWRGFLDILSSLNGFFSVIIEDKDFIYAAVDRVTSTPLMYKVDSDIWIGDNYKRFLKPEASIDEKCLEQYLSSGYVYGRKTLLKDVFQLRPGTALSYRKEDQSVEVEAYYEYLPDISNVKTSKENYYLEALDEVHDKVFSRLVKNLGGRKAILPLSGGYDSRLILEMLLRFNYTNILCVTWGRESDWQAKIAKDVAMKFGVEWLCIQQDSKSWRNWYEKGGFEDQLERCGALATIPYLQENVLIRYLEDEGLIDAESVFLNGNSGDFIEGDHIPENACKELKNDEIVCFIKNKHCRLSKTIHSDNLDDYLSSEVEKFRARELDVTLFFEYWEWAERQSKFVTKCIKPFEARGYEWRMPFWEREIMDFWVNVPIQQKKKRALYYSYFNKYMNRDVLRPNSSVSRSRIIYERITDQRFGMFFDYPYGFKRWFSSTSMKYNNLFSRYNVTSSESLVTAKLNTLVALDAAGTINELIS